MIKTLARRVAVGTLAAVAAIGVSTLFATEASAHTATVSGVAKCDDANGVWTITWTITNEYSTKGKIQSYKLTPADAAAKVPGSVDASSSATFTSIAKAGKDLTSAALTVTVHWSDFTLTVDGSAPLTGPCVKPTPTPSPSKTKPTESTPTPTPPASTPTPPAVTPTPSASVPSLPVTGSNTTYPMVGAGAGLIAAGGVVLFVIRRRRRVTFTAE